MVPRRGWTGSRSIIAIGIAAALLASGAPAARIAQSPNQMAANEAEAIATLRAIATAQETFKAAAYIDTNCDGVGEYGYFAELAGTVPMRVAVGRPCQPGAGSARDILNPPLLPRSFGRVHRRCVAHDGYFFEMWLPMRSDGLPVYGNSEDLAGGKTQPPFPGSINSEEMWCCYAWPIRYLESGRRAFFINQRGVVLMDENRSPLAFQRMWNTPNFDSAYTVPGDMSSPLRIGLANAMGVIWWPLP